MASTQGKCQCVVDPGKQGAQFRNWVMLHTTVSGEVEENVRSYHIRVEMMTSTLQQGGSEVGDVVEETASQRQGMVQNSWSRNGKWWLG